MGMQGGPTPQLPAGEEQPQGAEVQVGYEGEETPAPQISQLDEQIIEQYGEPQELAQEPTEGKSFVKGYDTIVIDYSE